MEHHFIELTESETERIQLLKQDNNLDKEDNLDQITTSRAVFAICGRINGKPANPRYIGVTDNLQESVKELFSSAGCVGDFLNSIKLKELIFQVINKNQMDNKYKEWQEKYKPVCNDIMNEVH